MAKKLKYKFRLVGGTHTQYEGVGKNRKVVTYKNGDIVISDYNLAEKFGKKFQPPTVPAHILVDGEDGEETDTSTEQAKAYEAGRQSVLGELAKTAALDKASEDTAKKEAGKPAPEPEASIFGSEHTQLFPGAVEEGLLVFQKDGFFTVVEADSPEEAVNTDTLESEEAVQTFISEFAGADGNE